MPRCWFFFFFFSSGEHKYLEKHCKFFGKLPTRCPAFPGAAERRRGGQDTDTGHGHSPAAISVCKVNCDRQKGHTWKSLKVARGCWSRGAAQSPPVTRHGSARHGLSRQNRTEPGSRDPHRERGGPDPPRCLRWTPDSDRKKQRNYRKYLQRCLLPSERGGEPGGKRSMSER